MLTMLEYVTNNATVVFTLSAQITVGLLLVKQASSQHVNSSLSLAVSENAKFQGL
jgi:hypothetical protein